MKLKYIMVECRGCETPLIFPEWMEHCQASGSREVVSAGFVRIAGKANVWENLSSVVNELDVHCYGESRSILGLDDKPLQSRGDVDADIIKRVLESQFS